MKTIELTEEELRKILYEASTWRRMATFEEVSGMTADQGRKRCVERILKKVIEAKGK